MDKVEVKQLIDSEQGEGFSENIALNGYIFYKNKSFIAFKINRIDDITVSNIKYIYSDNKNDLVSIIAYACNFWLGLDIKFIYYKEKRKAPYVIKTMESLGFRIVDSRINQNWKSDFVCNKCKSHDCNCSTVEAYS